MFLQTSFIAIFKKNVVVEFGFLEVDKSDDVRALALFEEVNFVEKHFDLIF